VVFAIDSHKQLPAMAAVDDAGGLVVETSFLKTHEGARSARPLGHGRSATTAGWRSRVRAGCRSTSSTATERDVHPPTRTCRHHERVQPRAAVSAERGDFSPHTGMVRLRRQTCTTWPTRDPKCTTWPTSYQVAIREIPAHLYLSR
jgi:hypothetical protein